MDQLLVPYRKGFNYGIGVKRASCDPLVTAVTGTINPVTDAEGGEGTFNLYRLNTTEDLEEHLGISVKASGGAGLFSASARFNFSQQCKVQTSSILLLVTATRMLGFKQIDKPVFDEHAAELVSDGRIDLFDQRYGDVFVRGLVSGGQFFGVVKIDTRSEESRQKIEGQLSGSYGLFKAEVGMDLSSIAKSENAELTVQLFYAGGKVETRPLTPEGLLQACKEWTATVDTNPNPYAVSLAPYVLARGPQPPNPIQLQNQQDVLARCAKLRSRTIDNQNLIEYMLHPKHADEFVPVPGGPDLSQLLAGFAQDLDMIADTASHALEHPKEACEVETYAREVRTPQMANYKLTIMPPNIPNHQGATVRVPQFADFTSYIAAEEAAANGRLNIAWKVTGAEQKEWVVLSQDPPPGTSVSPGATVTVTHSKVGMRLIGRVEFDERSNAARFGVLNR